MNLSVISHRTASAHLAQQDIAGAFSCLYKPTDLVLPLTLPLLTEAESHGRRVTNVLDVAVAFSKMCLQVELPDANPECDINFRNIPSKIMSMLLKSRTAPHDFTVTSPTNSLITLLTMVLSPDSSAYLVGEGMLALEADIWKTLVRKAQEAGFVLTAGRPNLAHLPTLGEFLGISIAVYNTAQNTFKTLYYADYLPTLLLIEQKGTMRVLTVDQDGLETAPRLICWSHHEAFLLQLLTQPLKSCIDCSHAKVGELRKIAADLALPQNGLSKAQLIKLLEHHHVTLDHARLIRSAAGSN